MDEVLPYVNRFPVAVLTEDAARLFYRTLSLAAVLYHCHVFQFRLLLIGTE